MFFKLIALIFTLPGWKENSVFEMAGSRPVRCLFLENCQQLHEWRRLEITLHPFQLCTHKMYTTVLSYKKKLPSSDNRSHKLSAIQSNSLFSTVIYSRPLQYVIQRVLKKGRVALMSKHKKNSKTCTYKCTLRIQNGVSKSILINLGFKPNNDKILYSALRDIKMNQQNVAPILEERRGKHEPKHKPIMKLFANMS